jgi:two-component system CheB/CheR fusion protein
MAKRTKTPAEPIDTPVVGIGASAGGITALQSLFQALPAHPNLAFVVIQHLRSGDSSGLVDLIGRWSAMQVRGAIDGERPERDYVYVASPGDVLEKGVFRNRPVEYGTRRPGIDTIDVFFESLAQDRGALAIAVILSGTGTDGTAGAICVKRAGGIVLVQDPLTAMHESMPRTVIARGAADYVLPVNGIAKQLALCASPSYVRPEAPISWTGEVTKTLDEIVGLIRKQMGFDLSGYKATPLLWRIQRRMDIRRVRSFQDYEALLRDDPAELKSLIRGIPIHFTQFFRDPDAWDVLSRDVVQPLVQERKEGEQIRAWTPACATGEEAYSIAMLLSEHAHSAGKPIDFQVFATDASPEILARASRGVFSENTVKCIPPERTARFFYAVDGVSRVKRSLREKMVFAPQDLLADPPFIGLDLVTCRNLLIYLDPEAIKRVLFLLHSSLRLGGYLFLGKGEALSPRQQGFEAVSTRWNIYRKVGPASGIKIKFPARLESACHSTAVPASAHRAAIEHFDLPSVLIDDQFHILRVYGDTEKILRLPAGQPTHNLLDLAQPELVADLKLAGEDALTDRHSVTVSGLHDRESGEFCLSMRLTPLQTAEHGGSPQLLVSFMRAQNHTGAGQGANRPLPQINSDVPGPGEWSEAIRISHEELEASREELQALNEELKASNEQLNIANEELNQANAQLQDKIAELEMQSRVLSSGAVTTLFLDQDLRVRWFTPAVSELFPLMPADAGRRITDLAQKFEDDNFIEDVRAVMQTVELREAEVRNVVGRWYLRRIRPYLSERKTAAGVAITFTDITERKQAETELRRSEASLAGQKEAFQAAINGAPLEASLGILVRTAIEQMGDGVRCAFYLADADGAELHHVTGMPEAYDRCVDGFKIGADSLACGLAVYTGRPVITPDVTQEARWKPWLRLAEEFEYRGCWSFPVETTASKVVGTFAMYHRQPRAPTSRDLELGGVLTRAAAIIISRHQEAEERARVETALRENRAKIASEFEDTKEIYKISSLVAEQVNGEAFHE